MKSFIINYDLRKKRDYQSLYDAIKTYNNWAHVLESSWIVKSNKKVVEIRDHLAESMDGDDGLFVAELAGAAAWKGVKCKSQWLKDNL